MPFFMKLTGTEAVFCAAFAWSAYFWLIFLVRSQRNLTKMKLPVLDSTLYNAHSRQFLFSGLEMPCCSLQ